MEAICMLDNMVRILILSTWGILEEEKADGDRKVH
jgi:hypothetical protein